MLLKLEMQFTYFKKNENIIKKATSHLGGLK